MRTRTANAEDFTTLESLRGFDFPMPRQSMIEAAELVIDDGGEIMLGAIAERTAEIYLFCPQGKLHPTVKLEGIRLLHGAIRDAIAPRGYTQGFSFVRPEIEKAFGRHLSRKFGWEKTWPAYRVLDWKGEISA